MKTQLHLIFKNRILFLCILFGFFSCQSEYQKMETAELSSGRKVNEIFLGLELGMTQKEFYEACWTMNNEGTLSNGPTELSVEYSTAMPSGNSAKMRFFPKFDDKKIYLMQAEFTYDSWAPWNEELSADKLLEDTRQLFEKWYGEGFIEVTDKEETRRAWVKVDGNRRIRIFKKHLSVVRAEIVDLPIIKKEAKPS